MIVISTFWMNKRHLDIIRIDRKKTKWGSRIKQYFNTGDTVGHDNTTKASRRAEEKTELQKRKITNWLITIKQYLSTSDTSERENSYKNEQKSRWENRVK